MRGAGVARIADVRRYPASRRHPHLGRDQLARSLPAGGVAYEWWGETLGGRRRARPIDATRHRAWREESFRAYADHMDEPEFRRAFLALLDGARTTPTAVMCAETVWWRCHRRLIADAAVLRGVDVLHLGIGRSGAHGSASRAADTPKRHVLHEAVRADADGWPVYDAE